MKSYPKVLFWLILGLISSCSSNNEPRPAQNAVSCFPQETIDTLYSFWPSPTTKMYQVEKIKYYYNDNQQLVFKQYHNSQTGAPEGGDSLFYDGSGNLVRTGRTGTPGDATYFYDSNGKLSRKTNLWGGIPSGWFDYEYNGTGQLIKVTYTIHGKLDSFTIYTYADSKSRNILTEKTHDPSGALSNTITYTWDNMNSPCSKGCGPCDGWQSFAPCPQNNVSEFIETGLSGSKKVTYKYKYNIFDYPVERTGGEIRLTFSYVCK